MKGLVDVWIEFDDLRGRRVIMILKQKQLHGRRIAREDGKVDPRFVRSRAQRTRRAFGRGEVHKTVEIIDDGLYLFSGGQAIILEGKLRVTETKATYGKGFQVSKNQAFASAKIGKRESTPLEAWSGSRSDLMARVNTDAANNLRLSLNVKVDSLFDVWLWNASYNAYTFMPGYDFRSPYGHRYVTVKDVFAVSGVYYNPAPPAPGGPVGTAAAPPVVSTPVPAPVKKDSTSAGRSN
jgi:hypothetical protein